MMQNLSEKDRRALRFGGIGVGLILVLILVVFPVLDYWDGLAGKVASTQREVTSIKDRVMAAAQAGNHARELQQVAIIHQSDATLNQQTARMLQHIEALPAYKKLSVRRLEGGALREEDSLHRSTVTLSFSGSLANLHEFLTQVEAASPALKVDRLNVNLSRGNEQQVEGQVVLIGFGVVVDNGSKA